MVVRTLRLLALAVAAWALLFAPGALAEEQPVTGAERGEQAGAAVIAPTFGADGLLAARACRVPAPDDTVPCEHEVASAAAPALVAALLLRTRWGVEGDGSQPPEPATSDQRRRGPPTDG